MADVRAVRDEQLTCPPSLPHPYVIKPLDAMGRVQVPQFPLIKTADTESVKQYMLMGFCTNICHFVASLI